MSAEASCPRCGGAVPIAELAAGDRRTVECGHCGQSLEVSLSPDGAETLFHPQLMAGDSTPKTGKETLAVDPGGRTVPVGSGTELLDATAGEANGEGVETVLHAYLVIRGALPGEERIRLQADRTVVGRRDADFEIDDPAISGRHFEIESRHGEFFIRDLASSNGTFVNGSRIRAVQLAPEDTIRAGGTTFVFKTYEAIAL